jgi:hypothetical protein
MAVTRNAAGSLDPGPCALDPRRWTLDPLAPRVALNLQARKSPLCPICPGLGVAPERPGGLGRPRAPRPLGSARTPRTGSHPAPGTLGKRCCFVSKGNLGLALAASREPGPGPGPWAKLAKETARQPSGHVGDLRPPPQRSVVSIHGPLGYAPPRRQPGSPVAMWATCAHHPSEAWFLSTDLWVMSPTR